MAFVVLFCACGPEAPGAVRVVNATRQPVDVQWNSVPLSRGLAAAEASPFLPTQAGPGRLSIANSTRDTLQLGADEHLSVLLTESAGALRVRPLVHRFAEPRATSIRVRVVHAADDQAVTLALHGAPMTLAAGADSGVDGVEFPANTPTLLPVAYAGRQRIFTIPALPAGSELLLVLVQTTSNELAMLGVAPSAALGFFESNGGAP
jgi:Domain of unknown function (DUF4397)